MTHVYQIMARPFSSLDPSKSLDIAQPSAQIQRHETRSSLHFFDLPPEVRDRIFGQLLDTRLVHLWSRSHYIPISEKDMFALQRHPWDLSTSVLLGSRQLYREASAVFHKRNLFTRVTILSDWTHFAEILLLEIAANVTFIGLAPGRLEASTQHIVDCNIMIGPSIKRRAQFMIPRSSLPSLVSFLSILCNATHADKLPLSNLELNVLNSHGLETNVIIENLLEPFRKIFNISHVSIDWPSGPRQYIELLQRDMARQAFDTQAWMQSISKLKENGTRAFENGVLDSAINFFEQAIVSIVDAYEDSKESRRAELIAMDNDFSKTVNRIRFECELGISMAFVNLDDCFDQARRAAMNAYHISCNRNSPQLVGSVPNDEAWFSDLDRAMALFCDGSAAMAIGSFEEARGQFLEARRLNPFDQGIVRAIAQAERRLQE